MNYYALIDYTAVRDTVNAPSSVPSISKPGLARIYDPNNSQPMAVLTAKVARGPSTDPERRNLTLAAMPIFIRLSAE